RPDISSMPILDRTLSGPLFLDDAHLDFGTHVGMQLDPDTELPQLADRLREIHLALVHLDPELLELALHIARRDRAVQFVLLPHLDGEAEADLGDARGLALGGALLVGALPRDALGLVGDLLLVRLGGRVGEPLRQQVVAGVAVFHLDHVARGAQMLHVFTQNHFHGSSSSDCRETVQAGAASGARASARVTHQASASAPSVSSTSHTGQPPASSRTVGSKPGYRPGATSMTRRTAPLASRVACHWTCRHTGRPTASGPRTATPAAV